MTFVLALLLGFTPAPFGRRPDEAWKYRVGDLVVLGGQDAGKGRVGKVVARHARGGTRDTNCYVVRLPWVAPDDVWKVLEWELAGIAPEGSTVGEIARPARPRMPGAGPDPRRGANP